MFLPFYVIEVEIKPQTGDVQYRSEDGGCYQRMHGSTSNVDHCMEEAEGVKVGQSNSVKLLYIDVLQSELVCHGCGEVGHRALQCKETIRESEDLQPFCYECVGGWVCPRLLQD